MFEFADVAGKIILHQFLQSGGRHAFNALAGAVREFFDKVHSERGNVFAAFSERR